MNSESSSFVPAWAAHAVWYQILPERFANGDPKNDPTIESLRGGRLAPGADEQWRVSRWTSDWYAMQPWETVGGKDRLMALHDRRYGGDLAGLIARLPYLKDLGVNAIYLNPVFDAPSHHKYDGASLHHIDPHFGPDPQGDRALMASETPDDPRTWAWTAADLLMLRLIDEVHALGMRIIFDGVFNHVGVNHWAFRDLVEKQQASRFADWFTVHQWRDDAAGKPFIYEAWRGYDTLPELRKVGDQLAPGPREYIHAATRRWLAPNDDATRGIDGWRLDVAPWVPHGFWKDWRRLVKSINPEAYLVAENIRDVAFNVPYLEGDEFDAVMNYNFAFACDEYFFRDKTRIATTKFDALLRELRDAYPGCVAPVQQNLFGSHDTARLASHPVNRDRLDYRAFDETYHPRDSRAPLFDTRKPNAHERQLHLLFALWQMTYLGAPVIFYGDEAGLWGANDPCCRKPMLWPELHYDDEAMGPDGQPRTHADKVAFDAELHAAYRRLIALRHGVPALRTGGVTTLLADDARQVLVHLRDDGVHRAVVAINRSEQAQDVSFPFEMPAGWRDRLNGDAAVSSRDGQTTLRLAPLWGAVLA
ncbi:MAG TPA: alpha-amylase family glycosyl hydrolase [Albitalea sp.]|nr:alpha-amylase family glycosyl hydrolase [Albitalea sp.]